MARNQKKKRSYHILSMSKSQEPLALWKYVVSGGGAGVIEISLMYPTDVIKTRAQLSTTSTSMLSVLRSIVQTQGVRGLYRGIMSPSELLQVIP